MSTNVILMVVIIPMWTINALYMHWLDRQSVAMNHIRKRATIASRDTKLNMTLNRFGTVASGLNLYESRTTSSDFPHGTIHSSDHLSGDLLGSAHLNAHNSGNFFAHLSKRRETFDY